MSARTSSLCQWLELRLQEAGIETDGLRFSGISGGAIFYNHPALGRIIINESDLILGEGTPNERNLFGMGFQEGAFQAFCLGYLGRSEDPNREEYRKHYQEGRKARENLTQEESNILRIIETHTPRQ